MESKKVKTGKFNITKYLPIFIILLAVTIVVGTTFAYFTDREDESENLTFSKVELSAETNPGVGGVIRDAIPGTQLVDGRIEFSKAIDSEPIYVRAKVSYSLANPNNTAMIPYVEALRKADKIGVVKTTQNNNAKWSEKEGNYYYLLDSTDDTKMKIVDTIDTYLLTSSFVVPRDLEQLPDHAQYMESVTFRVAFEAIQADNVSTDMDDIKALFNQTFPENAAEKIVYTVTLNNSGETNAVIVNDGETLAEPEVSKAGYTLDGWYTKDGSVTGDWGDKVVFPMAVEKSTQIYAKWVEEAAETGVLMMEVEYGGEVYQAYAHDESEYEDGDATFVPITGDFTYEYVNELLEKFTLEIDVTGVDLTSNTITLTKVNVESLVGMGLLFYDLNATSTAITTFENVTLQVVENGGVYTCGFFGEMTDSAGTHRVEVIITLLNVA